MKSLKELVLEYLNHASDKPIRPRALAKKLGIPKENRQQFEDLLGQLAARGQIGQTDQGVHRPSPAAVKSRGLIEGILRRTPNGGWFTPHPKHGARPDVYTAGRTPDDVFIFPEHLADAHDGDDVLVRILKKRSRGGRRTGRVEEVIERATHTFVGTYFEDWGEGKVRIDGGVFTEPVSVGDPGAKGACTGDKVVVEMIRFPTHYRPGEAVLIKLLGPRGQPDVDLQAIIHEFGLPEEFPEEVLDQAREQAGAFQEDELADRLDLTQQTIVTIDPADARDFDDAISLQRTEDGHWLLGVHIADVGHFVPDGTELDLEARRRGTSIYLPGRVIPMLPETISNSVASLQQGKVRLTKSVFIEFGESGEPLHTELRNSAIKVTRRFTYEEIMPIVREPERFKSSVSSDVRQLLQRMFELAMLLRQRRFEAGALELYLPEVKIQLDRNGAVTGAREVVHDESHQIIEEFMLAANIAVATTLADLGINFLRRTHGSPDPIKLLAFAEFVDSLGFPLKRYRDRLELQALLNRMKGQPFEQAVNYALLRSMRQAEYSGSDVGHYALAVQNYCHFTSPIRRYPDLTVHRLIDDVIRETSKNKRIGLSEAETLKLGLHCSAMERRAAEAERELVRVKLLTLLQSQQDTVFDAVITGVERVGVYCRCVQYPVDGLLPVQELAAGERLDFDRASHTFRSRRSDVQFRLGDTLSVRVVRADPDERVLIWGLATSTRQRGGRPRKSQRTKTTRTSSRKRAIGVEQRARSVKKKRVRRKGDRPS